MPWFALTTIYGLDATVWTRDINKAFRFVRDLRAGAVNVNTYSGEAVEECCGTGATLITSQLPVEDWHAYLGADRVADAILDRLIHNAHRIELSSKESLRKDRSADPHGGHPER